MANTKKKTFRVLFTLIVFGAGVYAAADNGIKPKSTKVAHVTAERASARPLAESAAAALAERDEYVLAAPPRGGYADQSAVYRPIAEFLSQVTGKRFVYRHADNWLSYSRDMTSGLYDVVFDNAASTSWRIERISHTPLVRLPDELVYVVIAAGANARLTELKHLAGHPVCAALPPDMATLALLSQFDNPARQPIIVGKSGPEQVYQGLLEGKCSGGVVAQDSLYKLDPGKIKVLHRHRALPNQAFSAGPRVAPELKARIRDGLLSVAGHEATAKLRAAYGDKPWVPASGADYAGFGKLLKDSLYYY